MSHECEMLHLEKIIYQHRNEMNFLVNRWKLKKIE